VLAAITKNKLMWGIAVALLIALVVILNVRKPVIVRIAELKPGELRVVVNATKLPVREVDIVNAGSLIAHLDLTEEEVQSQSVLEQSEATYTEAEKI